MMTAILLNLLLLLSILWVVLGIVYCYGRYREISASSKETEYPQGGDASLLNEEAEHMLVSRSRKLSSQAIHPTFKDASADISTGAAAQQEPVEENSEYNADGELSVDYTMEYTDEYEVLREEILWQDDGSSDVSPSHILMRDLERLSQWHKHDELLDAEDETEVVSTLQSLQGTDLMAQYMEQLRQQEAIHKKLLQAILKAGEDVPEEEITALSLSNIRSNLETQSLDYYL